jgi:hypothetical protein
MTFIENLNDFEVVRAQLIRALDTLRINKRVKHLVMQLRKANEALNDTIEGRSNNSLNRSGMSLIFIRKIEGLLRFFPPG